IAQVVGPDVQRLRANKDLNEIQQVSRSANPMVFNLAPTHATYDKAVRLAIATAGDPKSYGDAAYDGDFDVAASVGWYNKTHRCYDSEAAKVLPPTTGDVN